MPNPEILQNITNLAHQAKEFVDTAARTNLLHTLIDSGHPYGLILNSQIASFPSIFLLDSGGLSNLSFLATSLFAVGFSTSNEEGATLFRSFQISIANYMLVQSFGLGDKLEGKEKETLPALIASSLTGSSYISSKDTFMVGINEMFQTILIPNAPVVLGLMSAENKDSSKNIKIGKKEICLGSAVIKLTDYKNKEPYTILSSEREPFIQINPGDQIGYIHISSQAHKMHNLSPFEKTEQITNDFFGLLRIIDSGIEGLNSQEQAVVDRAKDATLIGISHLVRLVRRKTGLPTWKLDILPDSIQRFHQYDSQAVSNAFGGTRKVKPQDVEMMVITPQMRQALVTA